MKTAFPLRPFWSALKSYHQGEKSARSHKTERALPRAVSPYIIIALIYVVIVLVVDPRGEFPLNDDWSYTRSALQFARGDGMRVDEWSAPSLIGQSFYGGLLIRAFGMKFIVLRLSTLAASCAIAMALWFVFAQMGVPSGLAWVAVLSWVSNPLVLSLSFTYMTEVPFLFFFALCTVLYVAYLSKRRSSLLMLAGITLGYAFLIRQTAALFVAALTVTVLLDGSESWRSRLRKAALVVAGAVPFIIGYYAWLALCGGPTPATKRKFELLRHITTEQLAGNAFGLLFYVGFMLLPLWAALMPVVVRLFARGTRAAWLACLTCWLALGGMGLWWFHSNYSSRPYLPSAAFHSRMPFLLNVLYDTGLGPVTLDPAYFGPPPLPTYPRAWLIVTGATVAGLLVAGMLFSFALFRNVQKDSRWKTVGSFLLISFALVSCLEIVFSHLQEGGLFDRHLVIAAFPLCLAACLEGASRISPQQIPKVQLRGAWAAASYLLLVAFALFSIGATHDYLEWNRLRWDLGSDAIASGVNPLSLSAGFEFNAWHNYDVFRSRGHVETVYRWWYDTRDYLVTMTPEDGYRILRRKDFFSWIHRRTIPVYLLQKRGSE